MLSAAAIIAVALWPPSVLHYRIISDFWFYLRYSDPPTLVGERIFEVTPRWAALYWLAHLDAPILLFSTSIVLVALWKAFRSGRLSSKQAYLAVCLAFFFTTAMTAHIAGARNLLQFIGVLCLASGALFDEALGYKPLLVRFSSTVIMILAALNLVWFSQISSYTPFLATDGYQAFVKENEVRLREKAKALVYGLPVLSFYSQHHGTPVAWEVSEIPWTTRADAPLAAEVKYVLMPAFYNYMPAEQPMRRIIAEHWNVVWSFKAKHAWELRLYEKPLSSGNLPPLGLDQPNHSTPRSIASEMAISVANLRFPIRIGLLRKYKEPAPSETENENEGLAPDYSTAMNWFESAASKGSGETTHLGVLRDASTSTTSARAGDKA
jgi:hypothetical protein